MNHSFFDYLFWINIFLIFYSYIGFFLLIYLKSMLFPYRMLHETPFKHFSVSICLAVFNEEKTLTKKISNVLSLQYFNDDWEFIIVSDGSTDATNKILSKFSKQNSHIRFVTIERGGKNVALNKAVSIASKEILVFTDADTTFNLDALQKLLQPFKDPTVGCVAGNFIYENKQKNKGEMAYWNFDRILKYHQSKSGTMTSATGQIYAIRRKCFSPIPIGVTDDAFVSMQVVGAGYRIAFAPGAIGVGSSVDSSNKELKRKIRVMTASFRGLWFSRHLFNPFKYGFYSLQLFSHKVLRRIVAYPLLIILFVTPFLWNHGILYQIICILEVCIHILALIGFTTCKLNLKEHKIFVVPYYYYLVIYATITSVFELFRNNQYDIWTPQRDGEVHIENSIE